jgi:hypothetical protein
MANTQDIQFYVGEDIPINAVLDPVVDISGWAISFVMRFTAGGLPVLVTKTVGSGITIVSGPASTFIIQMLSADTSTLAPGEYVYDVQRTDVGNHRMLVLGTVTLLQPDSPISPP